MSVPILQIPDGFTVIDKFKGVINTRGQKANQEQNWGYSAKDYNGLNCILLYCNPGVYTIIDTDVLDQIREVYNKQVSWFLMKTGYIGCHVTIDGSKTCLTMHQYLMNHYGHGKSGPSIDHVNRNKLDNRLQNLRITTQSVQNENRDKVSRHKNAKDLPEEIKEDLPKFIVYYKEKVSDTATREFFTVEGHPLQKLKEKKVENSQTAQLTSRRWATTKSNQVSILDKLEQAKWFVSELQLLMEDPLYKIKLKKEENEVSIEVVIPKNEIIYEDVTHINEEVTPVLELPVKDFVGLKQWKTKQIHEAIQQNNENTYKVFCEQHNKLEKTWETDWITFVLAVKGKTMEQSESIIKAFVENLRRIRHNQLCASKSDVVERENREQWPATTVVKAFLEGKMDKFKAYTEAYTEENPEDPKWINRWTTFLKSLEANKEKEEKLKNLCSKFMTAQRTKKYRHKTQATQATHL
jgi:hypothetical protein